MQFRERSQKDFANVPKVLRLKSEKYAAIFSTKLKNVLGQGPNIYRKDIGFSNKCSSSKERFFGNVKCSFDTPHEIFWPKTVKILAVIPKVMDKNSMCEKYFFFSKTILRSHWKQFWQTLRIVFAKSPK